MIILWKACELRSERVVHKKMSRIRCLQCMIGLAPCPIYAGWRDSRFLTPQSSAVGICAAAEVGIILVHESRKKRARVQGW
ncbi:hypothetical protein F4819DRAFT_127608 [Hypoxylon fuscum]|nr:hypothetical protein F4819DRAFT_127608 [Hypoxylon fuscum]